MAEEYATVKVKDGELRGHRVASKAGGTYLSFQGIPYAKPPVGPLRFKDAQPPEPWSGVRDACVEGSACTQFNYDEGIFMGTEDCLFVNVYTPRIPDDGVEVKLPVMVWVHGGGFISGSGDAYLSGADYIVMEDVVLVTMNYRLGVFGFLYLDHEAAPGNAGLKDQVAALRWVKANISAFGGDAENITIFGESAGGASIHYLMLSPMTKGLFHRAIAQSGSVVSAWARQWKPVETTRYLAKTLGCNSDDPQQIVDFLRGIDHMHLVKAATKTALERNKNRLLNFSFVPSVERVVPNVETFLPKPVEQLMREGAHHAVPFMTGVNSHEAIFVLSFFDFGDPGVRAKIDTVWDKKVLPELRIVDDHPKAADALKDLRNFYMDGKELGPNTCAGFLDMITDIFFGEGCFATVRRMAEDAKAPLYLYKFSMDGELNWLKKFLKLDGYPGTCHADDLGYLFRLKRCDPDLPEDSPSAVTRRRMVRLWTNFAKTGDPTPGIVPLLPVKWKPYTTQERNYVDIGLEITAETDLWKKREDFWKEFYLKYV